MAQIKTIMVLAVHSEAGAELLAEAAALATARSAHLVALSIGVEPVPSYAPLPDMPLDGYFDELQAVRQSVRDTLDWARERLNATGVSFETRGVACPMGVAGPTIAKQARYADLTIIPRGDGDDNWQQLLEAALFESGRPVLLWPRGAKLATLGTRVAIGWDGGAEASRAVGDALGLMDGASDVRVVVVDPRVDADGHGEEPGADLATMLSRHGLPVTVDVIARQSLSVAEALLRHAAGLEADLIVAGAYGHSRFAEIILGGATRELMRSTDRALLMAH